MAEAGGLEATASAASKRPRLDSDASHRSKSKIRRSEMSDVSMQGVFFDGGSEQEAVSSTTDSPHDALVGCDSGFQELTWASLRTDEQDEGREDEDDDAASTVSEISGLSDLSDLSGHEWKPAVGPVSWIQRQMNMGVDPRDILRELIPKGMPIPPHLDEVTLWKIVVNMLSEPPRRKKLAHVNTIEDVVELLRKCNKIVILTGAGVSVSCGIPDFRSQDGIYARLSKDFPDLPDPQAMFDINYFRKDPRPFFKFAKEIYPGQFEPSLSHMFIRLVEQHGKLLTNYTQNIDTLEQAAGIQHVITCHGSFATATCTRCRRRVGSEEIKDDIFNQRIPLCKCCQQDSEELAVMKPDIVFFGEGLSGDFHQAMARDKNECDLLIVMGSSLKVRPVALIPSSLSPHVPQILINREPLEHLVFDVELLGDCDVIVAELCRRLGHGWDHLCGSGLSLRELRELPPKRCSFLEYNNNGTDPHQEAKTKQSSEEQDGKEMTVLPDSTSTEQECDKEWKSRAAGSISQRLPEGTFLFMPPSRYVFHGAEVYMQDEQPLSSDDSEDEVSSVTCYFGDESDEENDKTAALCCTCRQRHSNRPCGTLRTVSAVTMDDNACHATHLEATLDDGDSGYAASKSSSSDLQCEAALGYS